MLITGANGLFGRAFAEACRRRGISHQALARDELDIADPVSVAQAIERYQPWAVINTAGYTRIDRAESERQRCHRENTLGATVLAKTCGEREVTLVTFSTDMVFDGNKRVPYVEGDPVRPLNFFGHTKAIAERRVLARPMQALVIRTGACFAADEASDFGVRTFERLQNGLRITAPHDQVITATYLPDLVHVCLDLLIDGETGIWHLSNHGSLSWAQLALRAAEMSGADRRLVRRVPASELRLAAVRPEYSALGSIRGRLLPGVDSALERCVRQLHAQAGGRADSRPLAAGH